VDLITVGDVMIDVRVDAPALARGGDVHGRVALHPGGTSANAAVWATWDGASARVHARVGDDLAGRLLRSSLVERGVDPALVFDPAASTGTMLVMIEAGERSMVADRGASARLAPDDLPATLAAGAVLVSGYLLLHDATSATAIEAIRRTDARFVAVEAASWPLLEAYGPATFLGDTMGADVLLANGREAEALAGAKESIAAKVLGERYRVACVKLGARGAAMSFDGELFEEPAEPVDEVDPTGAGDAFDGVFLAELARGAEPQKALRRACHAGALVAGSRGAWPGAEAA
jgi:sugar/nucleoside kinase (ribokinase family)